jgi:cytochrome c oxidase assembly factor 5
MVDMRKRFRGNAPIAVSTELEGGGKQGTVPQLYGGKPAAAIPETKIDENAMDLEKNPRGL